MSTPDWVRLRQSTSARIGLGRAGNAVPVAADLELRIAHAEARRNVLTDLDVDALVRDFRAAGLPAPVRVRSRARDRAEYLRRPDLGRLLSEEDRDSLDAVVPGERHDAAAGTRPSLVVVCADGLSAQATQRHALPLLAELLPRLDVEVVACLVATQARVALGDPIGLAFGATLALVLIGERPGLSSPDSLSAYLTFDPKPGRTDAERNCVSNIRTPGGQSYAGAARVLEALVRSILAVGASGVGVKDLTSREDETRRLG
ncbi:ethanolamine ammonia-lyase subunit EutC [Nocardioides campestrisoli]|uniref:ethanolamine ammonia-lyase subunit EutC n=1 Tax=Nocardioides campestrisoli TaxID=2736757 RepID=UPI0015E76ADE|nr:ethanolamine ammonia-lyase subunit EutC [Nocardioides campestrisoli]